MTGPTPRTTTATTPAAERPVWAELFHQCALTAYVEEARLCDGWPASAAVRRRAYALYEAELRARHAPCSTSDSQPDGRHAV